MRTVLHTKERQRRASVIRADDTHLRPLPPDYLIPEEAEVWVEVVERMPAEWFPAETWAMLAAYCQHVALGIEIAKEMRVHKLDISKGPKFMRSHSILRAMLVREHRAMAMLATKLRLTPQSKYDAVKAKNKTKQEQVFGSPISLETSSDIGQYPDFSDDGDEDSDGEAEA